MFLCFHFSQIKNKIENNHQHWVKNLSLSNWDSLVKCRLKFINSLQFLQEAGWTTMSTSLSAIQHPLFTMQLPRIGYILPPETTVLAGWLWWFFENLRNLHVAYATSCVSRCLNMHLAAPVITELKLEPRGRWPQVPQVIINMRYNEMDYQTWTSSSCTFDVSCSLNCNTVKPTRQGCVSHLNFNWIR